MKRLSEEFQVDAIYVRCHRNFVSCPAVLGAGDLAGRTEILCAMFNLPREHTFLQPLPTLAPTSAEIYWITFPRSRSLRTPFPVKERMILYHFH